MTRVLNNPSFIVFSDDWGEHPSSCQHLFRALLDEHSVLWVNTIGMRAPTLSLADFRKAVRKISRMFRRRTPTAIPDRSPQPHVCQPFMLPFSSLGFVRRFNRYSVLRRVRRAIRDLNLQRPVVVTTVPNACDYVGELDASRVVYYCVDDFTQWPGLEHELVRDMEQELITRSDTLIGTSAALVKKLQATGKPTHLLTHGVDLPLFSRAETQEHAVLGQVPRPRVGYFGLFDERTDERLLLEVASSLPNVAFVISGPVAADTARLAQLANVHFTGSIDYQALPQLIKGLDALFIAYLVNDFTASISPLKLKEYLATGKPVIVTPLAEARQYSEHIAVAETAAQWRDAIEKALAVELPERRRARTALVANDSWSSKAQQFLALCRGAAVSAA